MADYFSFEDVMRELELGEEELKRMVSEGELRAFRDENKMKFKKEDVESLRKGRITEPTIILPSTPSSETTDETVLDLDIGQETAALSDTSASLKAAKTAHPKEESEDLVIQPLEVSREEDETFLEEETDTGLSTEPLKLADEVAEPTVEAETVTEPAAATVRRTGQTRAGRRAPARIPVAVEEEIERKRASPVWTILIFLALLASLYGGLFFYDMMRLEMGKSDQPSGLTAGLAQWTLEQFWKDPNWTKFHVREYPDQKQPPFGATQDPANASQYHYEGPSFLKGSRAPGASP